MKRPGVTMMILWEEYRETHLSGYCYSQFCDLLRGFERRLTPVMRQHHVAGDKAFVDYSGKRSARIGVALARRAAARPAGGLPLNSASIANSQAIISSACAAAGDFVSTWKS